MPWWKFLLAATLGKTVRFTLLSMMFGIAVD